jgi:hypothetical protein
MVLRAIYPKIKNDRCNTVLIDFASRNDENGGRIAKQAGPGIHFAEIEGNVILVTIDRGILQHYGSMSPVWHVTSVTGFGVLD